jgi:hypothetical protein
MESSTDREFEATTADRERRARRMRSGPARAFEPLTTADIEAMRQRLRESTGQPLVVLADPHKECEAEIRGLRAILEIRERELRDAKGPCSSKRCSLHRAHSGPCDIKEPRA